MGRNGKKYDGDRREAAQEKAQAALERINEGVKGIWTSERWVKWLETLSRFYQYSLGNTLLIALQMPGATHVASFRSWKRDFNRYVKKGEHGIEILVPMLVKVPREEGDEEDQLEARPERKRLVGFKVGHVFDISQTDGEPLPTISEEVAGSVDRYATVLDAVRSVSAYPITFGNDLPTGANGVFLRGVGIEIREGMSEAQTVKTALHELAHSRLHEDTENLPDRRMREMQAESVAYAVSAALGLDTSGYSFGYVASWAFGKSDEDMRACLQSVRDTVKQMVEDLEQAMAA